MKNGFDYDVPLPEDRRKLRKYRFDEMPVKASFAVPALNSNARAAASNYKRHHPGWDYTARTLTENGVAVIRIWRTA